MQPERERITLFRLQLALFSIYLAQFTEMLHCSEVCVPELSVTAKVNVNVPLVVGVPLIWFSPLDNLLTWRPGGSCPHVIDQV